MVVLQDVRGLYRFYEELALRLAERGHHAVAIGFYGRPGERDGHPRPIQRAAELGAPILALQAGADAGINAEENAEFEQALAAAGSSTSS